MSGPNINRLATFFLLLGLCAAFNAFSAEQNSVDHLFQELALSLGSSPEKAESILQKLKTLQPTFTPEQDEKYGLGYASALGFRGNHVERVALVKSYIDRIKSPARRASYLYELIDGSAALGQYENALLAMNESILLLPQLERTGNKIVVLQGAIALMNSIHAYDEALEYAQRIYALRDSTPGSLAECNGLADMVEINFLRGNSQLARSLVPDAILACDANKNSLFTTILKTLAAIDLIDAGEYSKGTKAGLKLFQQFSIVSKNSDYISQLEEAIARAYLKTGNLERAEHYGLQAMQRAQSSNAIQLQEKASETMAAIKRAQNQLAKALEYYDINLALKRKVLEDQLHKNLAFQRVKFETQDKANQMALLEEKNKNLSVEKELQNRKYQNLVLLLTLGAIVLSILGAWLIKALRQKNIFRVHAQIDALTQVNNRGHFMTSARRVFMHTQGKVSLVLFDMDLFKNINDSFGHSTGDWVLKNVCNTVGVQLRKIDILGRLGGEEFAICIPLSSNEDVSALAERCRAAIGALDTSPTGFSFSITASFGIATRETGESSSFEDTLVAADKALYLSKNEGRNRVTAYQHPDNF